MLSISDSILLRLTLFQWSSGQQLLLQTCNHQRNSAGGFSFYKNNPSRFSFFDIKETRTLNFLKKNFRNCYHSKLLDWQLLNQPFPTPNSDILSFGLSELQTHGVGTSNKFSSTPFHLSDLMEVLSQSLTSSYFTNMYFIKIYSSTKNSCLHKCKQCLFKCNYYPIDINQFCQFLHLFITLLQHFLFNYICESLKSSLNWL